MQPQLKRTYVDATKLPDVHLETIKRITASPFSRVDFYIVLDNTDLSEWIAFGLGRNHDSNDSDYALDTNRNGFIYQIRNTDLSLTSRIHTLYRGDPMKFDRTIPRPDVTAEEYLRGIPTHLYLMRIDSPNDH